MVARGQKINDRYQIIRLIGAGGMGHIYYQSKAVAGNQTSFVNIIGKGGDPGNGNTGGSGTGRGGTGGYGHCTVGSLGMEIDGIIYASGGSGGDVSRTCEAPSGGGGGSGANQWARDGADGTPNTGGGGGGSCGHGNGGTGGSGVVILMIQK